jgi:cysteinyl-tRNA synthetase
MKNVTDIKDKILEKISKEEAEKDIKICWREP